MQQDKIWQVWKTNDLQAFISFHEFKTLCGEKFNHDPLHYLKNPLTSNREIKLITKLADTIATGKPVALIKGYTEFLGNRIELKYKVLIPRPETEGLVLIAANLAHQLHQKLTHPLRLLEVGVGSGAVICSLAKILDTGSIPFDFKGIDISEAAVANTKLNLAKLSVSQKTGTSTFSIVHTSLLKYMSAQEAKQVDMIISNPPYLDTVDLEKADKSLAIYEPKLALTSGKDPLRVYRQLLKLFCDSTANYLVCEIASNHIEEITQLLVTAHISNYHLERDVYGRYRYLVCSR